ncbi:Mitogen-activated protein kinase kinase kinase 2 [Leucoagaricus sp. SymC.cos]|nr:Mitogen-activated protein kinase kinase kinase 2 [Leucoagaricus sp. SymC.cos]
MFLREAVVWSHLVHPNVLPFYGIVQSDGMGSFGLVSPWMQNGNLSAYLNEFPKTPRLPLVHDVLAGLNYLHDHEVVHGDLKGVNVLIDIDGMARLADFGLSTLIDPLGTVSTAQGPRGTIRWMAPEVLEGKVVRPCPSSDIYSVASVMYEILTGRIPFSNLPRPESVMWKVMQGVKPDKPDKSKAPELSDDVWKVMLKCWNYLPADRPPVAQVIAGLGLSSSPRPVRATRDKIPERTGAIFDSDIMFLKDTLGILKS